MPRQCSIRTTESNGELLFVGDRFKKTTFISYDVTMIQRFIVNLDVSILLLLQDFLKNDDSLSCTLICKSMQNRCKELFYDIIRGRTKRQMVIDAGRFWNTFDIDFQLKDRNRWNFFSREQFLSHQTSSRNNKIK